MKTQITVELSDDARMGISMARTGKVKLASREVCREWLAAVINPEVGEVEAAVAQVKQEILAKLDADV